VLVSRLAELEKIVDQYDVGDYIDNHDSAHIAAKIEAISQDPVKLKKWKNNTLRVIDELNWEKEGRIVAEIFEQVEQEIS